MTPDLFSQAAGAFHQALAMPPDARPAFLDSLPATLRPDVERMIEAHHSAPESFLSEPAVFFMSRLCAGDEHGQLYGPWKVLEEVGRGGMATVYLAERADGQFRKKAAFKILSAGIYGGDVLKRFERERQILADLDHPNIVRLLDGGVASDGRPYLVMDYVEGLPLMEYVKFRGLAQAERLALFDGICGAVEFAHAHNIVHRDLKPSNVCVTRDGNPKLLDFGIAKLLDPEALAAGNTRTGSRYLTWDYASPEQLQGLPTGKATDIYSLGLILYELVTSNRLPNPAFPGSNGSTASLDAAGSLAPVIEKALRLDPAERFPDVAAFRQAAAAPPPFAARQFPSRRLAITGIAAGAALAAGAWLTTRRPQAPQKLTTLTTGTASRGDVSLSPDGGFVAFTENRRIVTINLENGARHEPIADSRLQRPRWLGSRQFSFIRTGDDSLHHITLTPLGGGPERVVTETKDTVHSWSPDGKSLALIDHEAAGTPLAVYVVDTASGTRRQITNPPAGQFGDVYCVYSPDGARIAFVRNRTSDFSDLYVINAAGGEPTRVTAINTYIRGVDWTPDGSELVYSARRDVDQFELWRVPSSGGAISKIGIAPLGSVDPSLSRDPARPWRLAFLSETRELNIWRIEAGKAPALTAASRAAERCPAISPDGSRLAFSSARSGWLEIWVSDPLGGDPLRLTHFNGSAATFPHWSPDGRWITFTAKSGDDKRIFVVSADGGDVRQLIGDGRGLEEGRSSWSRDGDWIYYRSNVSGGNLIWKARSADGSLAQPVTKSTAYEAFDSPDGRKLYFVKTENDAGLWEKSFDTGQERPLLPAVREGFWDVGRDGIYFLHRPNRWLGTEVKLYRLASGAIEHHRELGGEPGKIWTGMSVSQDGKSIYWSRLDRDEGQVMLVDNFR